MLLLLTPFFFALVLALLAIVSWTVARSLFGFKHRGIDFRHNGKVLLLAIAGFVVLLTFVGRPLLEQYKTLAVYQDLTRFMLEAAAEREPLIARGLRTGEISRRKYAGSLHGTRWQEGLSGGDTEDWLAYAKVNAEVLGFIRGQHSWRECNALLINGKAHPQTSISGSLVGGTNDEENEAANQQRRYSQALVERVLSVERLRNNVVIGVVPEPLDPLRAISEVSAAVLDRRERTRWDLRSYVRLQMGRALGKDEARSACLWGVALHEEMAHKPPQVVEGALRESILFKLPE